MTLRAADLAAILLAFRDAPLGAVFLTLPDGDLPVVDARPRLLAELASGDASSPAGRLVSAAVPALCGGRLGGSDRASLGALLLAVGLPPEKLAAEIAALEANPGGARRPGPAPGSRLLRRVRPRAPRPARPGGGVRPPNYRPPTRICTVAPGFPTLERIEVSAYGWLPRGEGFLARLCEAVGLGRPESEADARARLELHTDLQRSPELDHPCP